MLHRHKVFQDTEEEVALEAVQGLVKVGLSHWTELYLKRLILHCVAILIEAMLKGLCSHMLVLCQLLCETRWSVQHSVQEINHRSIQGKRGLPTCNRADLQTLRSQLVIPKNLHDHWFKLLLNWFLQASCVTYSQLFTNKVTTSNKQGYNLWQAKSPTKTNKSMKLNSWKN